ncbi:MAG: hypothetical protein ACTSRS_13165 [Candidatus Helarchaeota archaeon]
MLWIELTLQSMDWVTDSYSQIAAICNFIAFGALCVCIAYLFITAALGQIWQKPYKGYSAGALLFIIVLLLTHFLLKDSYGIYILLPPVNTLYFTEFMHVIQYLASVGVIVLGTFFCLFGVLRFFDKSYGKACMSCLTWLIILFIIHYYIHDEFGVLIILPPTLW